MLILTRRVRESIQIGPDYDLELLGICRDQFGRRQGRIRINDQEQLAPSHRTLQLNTDIAVVLFGFTNNVAKVGISAPKSVRIVRSELLGRQNKFNNDYPSMS